LLPVAASTGERYEPATEFLGDVLQSVLLALQGPRKRIEPNLPRVVDCILVAAKVAKQM
jgi:hypothetical protein